MIRLSIESKIPGLLGGTPWTEVQGVVVDKCGEELLNSPDAHRFALKGHYASPSRWEGRAKRGEGFAFVM